jgi:hypothetical protein
MEHPEHAGNNHHHQGASMKTLVDKHGLTIFLAVLTWVFVVGTRAERQDKQDARTSQLEQSLGVTYVRRDVQEANERLVMQRLQETDRKREEFQVQILRRLDAIESELRERRAGR